MSPAIMFCGASDDGERFAGLSRFAKLFYPLLGVFLIGVLIIGVGARDFLCSTVAFGPDIFLFRRTSSGEQNIARSRGRHSSYACSPQLQRVRCSACSRLQC